MEVKFSPVKSMWSELKLMSLKVKSLFVKRSEVSSRSELNLKSFKMLFFGGLAIFILVTFLLPTEQEIEFTEKIVQSPDQAKNLDSTDTKNPESNLATQIWNSNSMGSLKTYTGGRSQSQINYNTSMIIGDKNGNAKNQLRAGTRVPLRIVDKFTVSQESVPILAESILNTITDSGLQLPAGTRFYGEASFQKGNERAQIVFRQISLPSGEIKSISGTALGKDGQPGVSGHVSSDGTKNAMGSLITTFIAGYASGSMETDLLGNSKGGVENGLKAAVAVTAKDQANSYGEKLKTQREWIEVNGGTECDAILNESLNLQRNGGEN